MVPKGRASPEWDFFRPRFLELLSSMLALVALAQHAFVTWSLSAPLTLVMDAYRAALRVVLGWADPYLQSALNWVGGLIGWRPTLYAHWRDVLVVMLVLVAASTRVEWRHGATSNTLLLGLVGGMSAIAAAIVTGLLPLQSDSLAVQMLIAALGGAPVIYAINAVAQGRQMSRSIVEQDSRLGRHPMSVAFFVASASTVVALASTGLLSYFFNGAAGFGLAGLAISIFVFGASTMFSARPVGAMGRNIVGSFMGAFCFFALDAGLKLVFP